MVAEAANYSGEALEDLKPVKSGKVKVNDVNLYYEIYGKGDPLVLVAGTGISLAPWRVSQVPEFAKHYQVRGLMALTRNYVAQVAFERGHLIDDQLLIFFDDLGLLLHELLAEHEPRTPVIALVLGVALLDNFQSRIQRHAPRIIFELLAVLARTGT